MSMAERLGRGLVTALSQPAPKKGADVPGDGGFAKLVGREQPGGAGASAAPLERGQGLVRIASPEANDPGFLEQLQGLARQIAALEQASAPAFAKIAVAAPEDGAEALGQLLDSIAAALGRLLRDFDVATGGNALETFRANLETLKAGGAGAGFAALLGGGATEGAAEGAVDRLVELAVEGAAEGEAAPPLAGLFAMVPILLGLPQVPPRSVAAQGGMATEPPVSAGVPAPRLAPALIDAQPGAAGREQLWQPLWRQTIAGQQTGEAAQMPSRLPLHAAASQMPENSGTRPLASLLSPDVIRGILEAAAGGGQDDAVDAWSAPEFASPIPEPRGLPEAPLVRQPEQPPAAPQPSGFARGIQDQIRKASFSDGRTRIELSPRGLGDIEIDIQTDEAGRLRVVVRAENPAVLHALRSDRDTLLGLLDESGLTVEDGNFELGDFGGHGTEGHAQPGDAPRPRPDVTGEEAVTAEPAPSAPRHNTISGGTLDIIT